MNAAKTTGGAAGTQEVGKAVAGMQQQRIRSGSAAGTTGGAKKAACMMQQELRRAARGTQQEKNMIAAE